MIFQRRSRARINIRLNEKKLFIYLYEHKVALGDDIHRDIYPALDRGSVRNRLGKLMRYGLVKAAYSCSHGTNLVYSLGSKGFNEFIKPLGGKVKRELGSQSVDHDLTLLQIRRMLQKSRTVKKYYPENLVTGGGVVSFDSDTFFIAGFKPDAVVKVEIKEKVFHLALEYEHSRKFQDRYEDLFRRYYGNKSVLGILYICANDRMLKTIQSYERKQLSEQVPKFYYSDFSKWTETGIKVFTNLEGACITL
jgi:hypothetical protein